MFLDTNKKPKVDKMRNETITKTIKKFNEFSTEEQETILNNSIIFAGLTTYPISVLLENQQTFKRFFK